MQTFFKDLFGYNQIVNGKMATLIRENQEIVLPRTIDLYDHILLVHQSWNNRMTGIEGLTDFWQPVDSTLWESYNTHNNDQSLQIVKNRRLAEQYTYKNSKGAVFSNSFADTCFHIINHSNYHRGQINMELRSVGIEPVITDYIFYKR